MKLRFLCPQHRLWLEQHSTVAAAQSRKGYAQAIALAGSGRELDAIDHAGCALEAAEIVLTKTARPQPPQIHHYARTGALLARLLLSWGQPEQVRALLQGCLARLEALMHRTRDCGALLEACGILLGEDPRATTNPPRVTSGAGTGISGPQPVH